MKTEIAYISLGSNYHNAEEMLARAALSLGALAGCMIAESSPIYHTEPQGLKDQPWFANQVLKLQLAGWPARDFLECILNIERRLGRVRGQGPRFGPRAIDMDLLLHGQAMINDSLCILPHPRMLERAFVLKPLLDIDPDIRIGAVAARDALGKLRWHQAGDRIYQTIET